MTSPTYIENPEFRGRIGIARNVITPPVGIYARAWGSALHDVAEGVHRPLLASCLVIQDSTGSVELVLLALDAMIFWHEEAARLRAAILDELNIAPQNLILHPSHSHGTPMLARRHGDRPGGEHIATYLDSLPRTCCELVGEARRSSADATLSWTYGKCSLAFNRDAIDPKSQRDVCGLNPSVEADDTVLVGRIANSAGYVTGTIVNYACHPVSLGGGNRLLSPDYIGSMRQVIEDNVGGTCIFLHGASGDMTPRRSYEASADAADQNGLELGYAALSALSSMFPPGQRLEYSGIEESGTALGVWRLAPKPETSSCLRSEVVRTRLPLRSMPSREDLERGIATCRDRHEIERLERALARRTLAGDGVNGDFQFTVWRLGEAFIVATPAEPYSQFQVDLRASVPGTAIAVLNASDGSLNYLPTRSAYVRNVYQVQASLYEAGALEQVTTLASSAILRMK